MQTPIKSVCVKAILLRCCYTTDQKCCQYRAFLKENGIRQSMSRKGNCLDNAPTENFFWRMKTELYYDKDFSYQSLQQLRLAISEYIEYYNNERIVNRSQCSPVQYKNKLITASSNI